MNLRLFIILFFTLFVPAATTRASSPEITTAEKVAPQSARCAYDLGPKPSREAGLSYILPTPGPRTITHVATGLLSPLSFLSIESSDVAPGAVTLGKASMILRPTDVGDVEWRAPDGSWKLYLAAPEDQKLFRGNNPGAPDGKKYVWIYVPEFKLSMFGKTKIFTHVFRLEEVLAGGGYRHVALYGSNNWMFYQYKNQRFEQEDGFFDYME